MGRVTPTPACHMGSRPPRFMYPAWTAKSGLKSRRARSIASCSRSTAGGAGAQLGAAWPRPRACSAARSRGSVRSARRTPATASRVHLAADEARELRLAGLDLGFLLRAERLEAGDLDLGAQHVLLRALAHGVARARDRLGFLPDLLLLAEQPQRLLGEDEVPEGPAHAGRDGEALPLEALGGKDRVLRRDLLAKIALAGPGQGLAAHHAERRHVALARGSGSSRR